MIFISVGTQRFQFDRLLSEIDKLIENGIITDKVFAQIGHSTYVPKNYEFTKFLNQHDFHEKIDACDVYITHGGVGSIQNGLKMGKKVIIVPRLSKYGEHVDDHQIEIATKYSELGFVKSVVKDCNLEECIRNIKHFESSYIKNEGKEDIKEVIRKFIDEK